MPIFPWNKKDPITEELLAANMLKTSEKKSFQNPKDKIEQERKQLLTMLYDTFQSVKENPNFKTQRRTYLRLMGKTEEENDLPSSYQFLEEEYLKYQEKKLGQKKISLIEFVTMSEEERMNLDMRLIQEEASQRKMQFAKEKQQMESVYQTHQQELANIFETSVTQDVTRLRQKETTSQKLQKLTQKEQRLNEKLNQMMRNTNQSSDILENEKRGR